MQGLGVGEGYAELTGGVRGLGLNASAFARGELGYRPAAGVSLFAFGEVSAPLFRPAGPEWMAGVGARFTW